MNMKKMMALVLAIAAASTLMAVPAQFSYQGVLKDTSNAPLTGNKQVQLRLYNAATGGNALWGRTYAVLLDANGLFNIEVSDSTGTVISGLTSTLDAVFTSYETIYIGLTVGGSSGEIQPRQKLLSVPYAAVASNVSRASGNFTVSGTLTAQNAVFSNKVTVATLTVDKSLSANSVSISGGAVTVGGNLSVSGTISGFGIVPVGSIIMWSGTSLPSGWVLCDGQNGTPDLRGRFIVGAGAGGSYAVGNTGGDESVTLTVAQMPSHSHSYSFKSADLGGSFKKDDYFYCQQNPFNLSHSATTDAAGDNQPHENRPPYYALCFIMRKQ